MEFLCQRKKSSDILPKQNKTCLYLLLVMAFALSTFRTGELVVIQSSQGKRKKQQEAVIFDLELISDSSCCYHCSMVSVARSHSVPPPYKNVFSLVHQPVSNMVLSAIGQCLSNSFFTVTFNYIKFLTFTKQINLKINWSFLELWLHQQLSLHVYSHKFFHDQFLIKDHT